MAIGTYVQLRFAFTTLESIISGFCVFYISLVSVPPARVRPALVYYLNCLSQDVLWAVYDPNQWFREQRNWYFAEPSQSQCYTLAETVTASAHGTVRSPPRCLQLSSMVLVVNQVLTGRFVFCIIVHRAPHSAINVPTETNWCERMFLFTYRWFLYREIHSIDRVPS